jgi:hypothetical protein
MYNVELENNLISVDIVDMMQDYVSVQLDIDSTRIKAAANVAQTIDITRVIGVANLQRVKDPQNAVDDAFREMIIPAWIYYTHARLLKMFNGTLTDSGYIVTEDAERGAKQSAKDAEQAYSIAEMYMNIALDYLDDESDTDVNIDRDILTPKFRTFGGGEQRGSN